MDTPFQFDRYVTGKYFVGRKKDCELLAGHIAAGRNVVLCGVPKSGKMSLVMQTIQQMKARGAELCVCNVRMPEVRNLQSFVRNYAESILNAVFPSRNAAVHAFAEISGGKSPDSYDSWSGDVDFAAELPYRLAAFSGKHTVLILDEFHNVDTRAGEVMLSAMEAAAEKHGNDADMVTVFMGSMENALEDIFFRKKFFWKNVERLDLSPLTDAEIADHVLRGFMAGGKVIDRDLLQGVLRMFGNNMWYINNFFFICDSLSKGYISDITLSDAMSCMLSVHVPRFVRIMRDLTDYQVRMLRAVLDGVVKFSTVDVIEKYDLSSSANVKRLKDALMKKEIIRFDSHDEAMFLDPLFEYWLRNTYFG